MFFTGADLLLVSHPARLRPGRIPSDCVDPPADEGAEAAASWGRARVRGGAWWNGQLQQPRDETHDASLADSDGVADQEADASAAARHRAAAGGEAAVDAHPRQTHLPRAGQAWRATPSARSPSAPVQFWKRRTQEARHQTQG